MHMVPRVVEPLHRHHPSPGPCAQLLGMRQWPGAKALLSSLSRGGTPKRPDSGRREVQVVRL